MNVNKIWRFESVKRQNFAYDSPRRNIDHIERVRHDIVGLLMDGWQFEIVSVRSTLEMLVQIFRIRGVSCLLGCFKMEYRSFDIHT